MVKGVTRQVIVVKSPDPKLFEQAIFIMREDAFVEGVSADQVIQEAQPVSYTPPDVYKRQAWTCSWTPCPTPWTCCAAAFRTVPARNGTPFVRSV